MWRLRGVDQQRQNRRGPSLPNYTISQPNAATVLRPFLIVSLAETARQLGPASWQEGEETMITAVSKAWAILAPLGVETSDLRSLMDRAVRTAWKTKKDK